MSPLPSIPGCTGVCLFHRGTFKNLGQPFRHSVIEEVVHEKHDFPPYSFLTLFFPRPGVKGHDRCLRPDSWKIHAQLSRFRIHGIPATLKQNDLFLIVSESRKWGELLGKIDCGLKSWTAGRG
jgi:hypothetical protein